MSEADVIAALALPDDCHVDQRVSKKLLVEHGAPTAADKRQIESGIEELRWVAALKPTGIGVPEYHDDSRKVVEIAVLTLSLRPEAKAPRLTELIHRAVPHPLLLVATQSNAVTLSVANKRHAENEAGKMVLDDVVTACPLVEHAATPELLRSLSIAAQPRAHLFALYQGWIACLEAYQAAQLTGRFAAAPTPEATAARREALAARNKLQRDIASLRAQATKEKQINRRVELNLEIKRLDTRLGELGSQLLAIGD